MDFDFSFLVYVKGKLVVSRAIIFELKETRSFLDLCFEFVLMAIDTYLRVR